MANRKKDLGMRYALYVRCSSDDQKHKDFSTTEVQEGLNRAFVQEKGGLVAGLYKDEAVSGTTLARKGYSQLLADAQSGKFDAVIVTYMSRLGRGRSFVIAEYELEKCGVRVEMVKEQFTDDIGGYMGKNMTNVMDGMYAFQVRQWTMTKMEAMVEAGYFPGGYPPFGLIKVVASDAAGFHRAGNDPPKRLVPDPEAADIVRQAFALFLEARSLAEVRAYLNSVTDRTWTTTRAKAMLMNEAYKGSLVFGQWRNETAWEPVVSRDTWEAAQGALVARTPRPPRPDAGDFTYYLRGRVYCPHCHCPYTQSSHWGRGGIRAHYYVCQTANRQTREGSARCPVGRVNAGKLHTTVLHFIERGGKHRTFLQRVISQSGGWMEAEAPQKTLRGQLGKQKQAMEMRIANYVKAIGDGRDSPALLAALERAEAERVAVVKQIEEADRNIAAATARRPTAERLSLAWERSMAVWEVLTEEERTELLGSLVQAVEVTNKKSVALELLPVVNATLSEVRATPSFGSGNRKYLHIEPAKLRRSCLCADRRQVPLEGSTPRTAGEGSGIMKIMQANIVDKIEEAAQQEMAAIQHVHDLLNEMYAPKTETDLLACVASIERGTQAGISQSAALLLHVHRYDVETGKPASSDFVSDPNILAYHGYHAGNEAAFQNLLLRYWWDRLENEVMQQAVKKQEAIAKKDQRTLSAAGAARAKLKAYKWHKAANIVPAAYFYRRVANARDPRRALIRVAGWIVKRISLYPRQKEALSPGDPSKALSVLLEEIPGAVSENNLAALPFAEWPNLPGQTVNKIAKQFYRPKKLLAEAYTETGETAIWQAKEIIAGNSNSLVRGAKEQARINKELERLKRDANHAGLSKNEQQVMEAIFENCAIKNKELAVLLDRPANQIGVEKKRAKTKIRKAVEIRKAKEQAA